MTGDRRSQQPLLLWEQLIAAQLPPQKSSANPRTAAWGYILPLEKRPGWLPASREGDFNPHSFSIPFPTHTPILPHERANSATLSPVG